MGIHTDGHMAVHQYRFISPWRFNRVDYIRHLPGNHHLVAGENIYPAASWNLWHCHLWEIVYFICVCVTHKIPYIYIVKDYFWKKRKERDHFLLGISTTVLAISVVYLLLREWVVFLLVFFLFLFIFPWSIHMVLCQHNRFFNNKYNPGTSNSAFKYNFVVNISVASHDHSLYFW